MRRLPRSWTRKSSNDCKDRLTAWTMPVPAIIAGLLVGMVALFTERLSNGALNASAGHAKLEFGIGCARPRDIGLEI